MIALAWHRDRYRSPAAAALVEQAGALCRELEQRLEPELELVVDVAHARDPHDPGHRGGRLGGARVVESRGAQHGDVRSDRFVDRSA